MAVVTRRVFLKNESMEPLSGVVIELYNTRTNLVLARATTDGGGIAAFSNVDVGKAPYWFRPLITRMSGRWGKMPLVGGLHLNPELELPPPEPKDPEPEEPQIEPADDLVDHGEALLLVVKEDGTTWLLPATGEWKEQGTHFAGNDDFGYSFRASGVEDDSGDGTGYIFAISSDDNSLMMSDDGGLTFDKISDIGDGVLCWAFDGTRLWYTHFSGIKFSDDLGGSWSSSHTFSTSIAAMVIDPNDPDHIIVSHTDDAGDNEPAITYTETGGGSWSMEIVTAALSDAPRNPYFFGNAIQVCITLNGFIYVCYFEESANAVTTNRLIVMGNNGDHVTWVGTGATFSIASSGIETEIWSRALFAAQNTSTLSTGFILIRPTNATRGLDSGLGTSTSVAQPSSALVIGTAYDRTNAVLYLLYANGETYQINNPMNLSEWADAVQLATLPDAAAGDTDSLALYFAQPSEN